MIKINGTDVYYILRDTNGIDSLLESAPNSLFNIAVPMEMYINSYSGFQGEGDLLTKFGLSIADKLVLSVSRSRFGEDIGSMYDLIRPREGDLVFFPFTKGIFEIKFEKFNYNSERFNTGIPEIDSTQTSYSVADDNFAYLTENEFELITESGYDIVAEYYAMELSDPVSQNKVFDTETLDFIDFSATNPFSESF